MTAKSTIEFNEMYGLPVRTTPGFPPEYNNKETLTKRLSELREMLLDEVDEVDDIAVAIMELSCPHMTPAEWSASTKKIVSQTGSRDPGLTALVMLADWLGDLRVYCESEMIKFGLNSETVHVLIMGSNMTKLDEQGMPIIKEGKVQKGPNFVAPEQLLCSYIKGAAGMQELVLGGNKTLETEDDNS